MSKRNKGKKKGVNKELPPEDVDYDSAYDTGETDWKPKGGGYGSTYQTGGNVVYAPRCHESHPPLKIGGGTLYGGSCSSPVCKDADVYVGLDSFMNFRGKDYPWLKTHKGPEEFLFKITDMSAPSDSKNFILMIDWLKGQLAEGKKVHVGCIGGHGRTGMVISALVNKIMGEEDAITWVRKNYCKKAVESQSQVDFLNKYFGIKKVDGAKGYYSTSPKSNGQSAGPWATTMPARTGPPAWVGGSVDSHGYGGTVIPVTTMQRTLGPRDILPPLARALRSTHIPEGQHSIWALPV